MKPEGEEKDADTELSLFPSLVSKQKKLKHQ